MQRCSSTSVARVFVSGLPCAWKCLSAASSVGPCVVALFRPTVCGSCGRVRVVSAESVWNQWHQESVHVPQSCIEHGVMCTVQLVSPRQVAFASQPGVTLCRYMLVLYSVHVPLACAACTACMIVLPHPTCSFHCTYSTSASCWADAMLKAGRPVSCDAREASACIRVWICVARARR